MKRVDPAKRAFNSRLRGLIHDFNNLLTAIISTTDLILERTGVDPETRVDVAHVREGALRGAGMIQRVRSNATAPSTHGIIHVNETIRATSRLLAYHLGAEIALTLDLEEIDDRTNMDPSQLDRVLLNLITNASHAVEGGGTVILKTEHRQLDVAERRMPDIVPAGDYIVIGVTDTGIGIPAGQIQRVFEPGFSSRRLGGGSGLGLSSVSDIVHQSDGFVVIESAEGQGTRVEIYLPRQTGAVQSQSAVQARPIAVMPVVLLVEDDPLVREASERILRRAGWKVFCADSAEAALEVLPRFSCNLIVTDVTLPTMDGLSLARVVISRHPDLPIILTSGFTHFAKGNGFGDAKVAFLVKPYGRADLLAAVNRIIRAAGPCTAA
jgi:two-component system cell cycle sensor histidine kinase/response regulator CckA